MMQQDREEDMEEEHQLAMQRVAAEEWYNMATSMETFILHGFDRLGLTSSNPGYNPQEIIPEAQKTYDDFEATTNETVPEAQNTCDDFETIPEVPKTCKSFEIPTNEQVLPVKSGKDWYSFENGAYVEHDESVGLGTIKVSFPRTPDHEAFIRTYESRYDAIMGICKQCQGDTAYSKYCIYDPESNVLCVQLEEKTPVLEIIPEIENGGHRIAQLPLKLESQEQPIEKQVNEEEASEFARFVFEDSDSEDATDQEDISECNTPSPAEDFPKYQTTTLARFRNSSNTSKVEVKAVTTPLTLDELYNNTIVTVREITSSTPSSHSSSNDFDLNKTKEYLENKFCNGYSDGDGLVSSTNSCRAKDLTSSGLKPDSRLNFIARQAYSSNLKTSVVDITRGQPSNGNQDEKTETRGESLRLSKKLSKLYEKNTQTMPGNSKDADLANENYGPRMDSDLVLSRARAQIEAVNLLNKEFEAKWESLFPKALPELHGKNTKTGPGNSNETANLTGKESEVKWNWAPMADPGPYKNIEGVARPRFIWEK